MSTTEQHLKRILDKLQQFLKLHAALQKENVQLKEELKKSKEEAKGKQQQIDILKQKVDILKLNTGEMSEADKKEFEKKINTYLKEIDRCIAMLGG